MSGVGVVVVWAVLGASALGLWGISRRAPERVAPPRAVVRRVATGPVTRVLALVGWMWVGWHLFAR